MRPIIRGKKLKKKVETPDLIGSLDSVTKLASTLNEIREEVEERVEDKLSEVEETLTEVRSEVERLKEIKKGEDGETPEVDYDYILSQIPEPEAPDLDEFEEKILAKFPKIDLKKLKKEVLSSIPDRKADLKIIQQNLEIDPMSVIDKIMALPEEKRKKLRLSASNIDGLDQTISAFHNQIGRRGYLHGGGDTVVAGSNITITTNANGQKVISSTGGGGGTYFVDETPDSGTYGLLAGDVDGVNDTYTVSEGAYVTGKLIVWLNGQQISQGAGANEYIEGTPGAGTFTFNTPPETGDVITAQYMTVSSSGGIESIVAGTPNVTIDNTDPFNPIISVAGAGTGTVTSVSGVNANGFTWSIATATTTPAITLDVSGLDAAKIADGSVSNTEFQYLNGVTSAIQTQLDAKQASLSGLAITGVTPVGNDKVLIQDISDSDNLKYVTVNALVAMAPGTPGGNDTEFQFNDGGSFGGTPKIYTPDSGSTVLLIDNSVAFADQADNSRRMIFDTSGVSAATTRTLTVQNVSGTIYVSGGTDVPVADGGTGASTLTGILVGNGTSAITGTAIVQGDLFYGSAANTLTALAKNTSATRYLSNTGTSNNPAWAQIDLSNGVTGDLPFANLTQIAGLSVLGVTGNSTADVAAITAGSDGHVLRRSGTTLAFGTVATAGIADNAITYAKIQEASAHTFLANNTSGTTELSEHTYNAPGQQVLTATITWTAGVAPSGATTNTYNWTQIGNLVTYRFTLSYAIDGTTVTNVLIDFPSDMPAPVEPTGFTGASDRLYTMTGQFSSSTTGTGLAFNGGGALRRNAGDTAYEFNQQVASGTYSQVWLEGNYFTS